MPHTNSDGDKNIDFSGLRQFTIHNPIDDDDELADLDEVKAISHPVGQHQLMSTSIPTGKSSYNTYLTG